MNPVVESLVESIGLRNAFRVLAALTIVIGLPCSAVLKQPDFDAYANDNDVDDVDDLIMEDCDDETVLVHRNKDDVQSVHEIDDAESESSWLAEMIRKEKNPPRRICGSCYGDLWLDPFFIIFMVGQLFKGVGYVFPFIHLVSPKISPPSLIHLSTSISLPPSHFFPSPSLCSSLPPSLTALFLYLSLFLSLLPSSTLSAPIYIISLSLFIPTPLLLILPISYSKLLNHDNT